MIELEKKGAWFESFHGQEEKIANLDLDVWMVLQN